MTTSGVSAFNIDLTEIIEEAFERCGGESRTGYDIKTARRSLNLLFADWANRGINMWTFEQQVITLVQGQPTYALPDDTVDLLEHVIRTNQNQPSNQSDLTITRISMPTYATLPNKLTQGRPIQVWIQRLTAQDSVLPSYLFSNINATDTSIPVTSLAGIPNAGFITIGNELIAFNEFSVATSSSPAYLLNCNRGQNGTTAASHTAGTVLTLSQKPCITVWPTPDNANTYQFVYWRMRRMQDAGAGANVMDVPFRFITCMVAGLSYYMALKVPNAIQRIEILKSQYDEAWNNAAQEDQEKAAVRFVPRQMYIGGSF